MTERAAPRGSFADVLESRREDILRRWELRVQAALAPGAVSQSDLRDGLPAFLDALAEELRQPGAPGVGLPASAEPSAQAHGRQRFRLGFDIEAVVREYGLLRDVLLELLEEAGPPLPLSEVRRLNTFLDAGIAEAVGWHGWEHQRAQGKEGARLPDDDVQAARSARIQAERDEARGRLRQVLTHLPIILWAFDKQGTITVSEGAGLAALGLRPGELVGRSMHTLYADREDLHAYARRALAGESFTAQVDLGSAFLDVRFSPVSGPDGEVVSVTGLSLDISERSRTERVLRQSEARYRLATLATSDTIWDWDFALGLIHWSENLQRVFGWGPGELDTDLDWWSERLHPEDRERVMAGIQAAIDGTGTYWEDEYRFQRRDGTWAHVVDRGSMVRDARGQAVRMVGAMQDVTERKAAEAEAQRRADFEQLLIGIVSHDLRSPISAIITSAATLLRRPGLDERLERGIGRILSSAERANRMLRDVLDFTQARLGGGIPVVPRPMDFHTFTWGVLDEVQLAWPERRLERAKSGDGQGEWDGDRLAQIVTNLVNNALTYSPPDTPVRVETRGEGDAVVLSVRNAGAPIPPELVPGLFEPLKRGERGARRGQGLGLGLFIVKHLVDAHGGTLEVRSEAEAGTTFTVRLPRRPPSRAERPGPA